MYELLWLLLPVAALSGWVIGRRPAQIGSSAAPRFPEEYFQGVNFLLNEEPDKAIEVFTRMVEVDSDTVETHLALGNLFRRRGEVDRAIRIHQNLIARPSLHFDRRAYALLELAKDYMRAGVLDRAEHLFEETVKQNHHADVALRHLLEIYQQEKEWEHALHTAERLENVSGRSFGAQKAQFCCELTDTYLKGLSDAPAARASIKRSLGFDAYCVRAAIQHGDLERRLGNWRSALQAYERVRRQDAEYLPEVLNHVDTCYSELDQPGEFRSYLYDVLNDFDGASVVMKLSQVIALDTGRHAAVEFLASQLRRRPTVRGLNRLIELNIDEADPDRRRQRDLRVLRDLFTALLENRLPYRCRECGFEGRFLHWHCPSCRAWGSIKPIKGVLGE